MSSNAFIGPEPFVAQPTRDLEWSSAAGLALMRQILHAWPVGHDPHDYLLSWSALVLEGRHLFGTTATGDGKTCVFYYVIIIMLYFARRGWKPPRGRVWPKHPLAIIVCPVIGIEEQMSATFSRLRLKNIVWNGDTLRVSPKLALPAAVKTISMLILSPEMLRTRRFQALIDIRLLQLRIAILGIDEVHLLLTWGRDFRQAFRQIGVLRSRLNEATRVVALTASIKPGREVAAIYDILGLRESDTAFRRRTNLRGNVRLERRIVSLSGLSFPDFDFFVSPLKIKSILFCGSLSMAFRVAADLWPLLPPGAARATRIRIYTSLYPNSYNEETRRLLEEHDESVLVLATCALSVGVDISKVDYSCILGVPESTNQIVQETGRVARGDRTHLGRGILFVPHGAIEKAQQRVAAGPSASQPSKASAVSLLDAEQDTGADLDVAKVISAQYVEVALDEIYGNPDPEVCNSEGCDGQPISGCIARSHRQSLAEVLAAVPAVRPSASAQRGPLTAEQLSLVVRLLREWRRTVWLDVSISRSGHLTETGIVSNVKLERLAEQLYDFKTQDDVRASLEQLRCPLALGYEEELFQQLMYAQVMVERAKTAKREEAAEKRKATAAAATLQINASAFEAILSHGNISRDRIEELAETPASHFYSQPVPQISVDTNASTSTSAAAGGSNVPADAATGTLRAALQDATNKPLAAKSGKGRKRVKSSCAAAKENGPPQKRQRRG